MAFLNNNTITVNAVLTKKGRELLAANGGLNINSFALADDEIDYTLYQPNHPKGSAYYDLSIRNTPIFEAFTDETQVMKYKLVTLPSGTTSVPVILLDRSSILVDKNFKSELTITPATNPVNNTRLGYTAILNNKNVGTIIGEGISSDSSITIPSFLGDLASNSAQVAVGFTFKFIPNSSLTQNTSTRLIVVGNETGGSVSIPVTIIVDTISESTLNNL
jgi:hypothetical protein